MVDYKPLARKYGIEISQTLDAPIKFLDLWELSDVLGALGSILLFGIVLYSWGLMILALLWFLIISPKVKEKTNRGVMLHFPYRKFGMKLPGIMNPRQRTQYSD